MSRRILIGYEGSDQSEDALVLGGMLADVLNAEPLVLYVVRLPEQVMGPALEIRVGAVRGDITW